MSVNSSIEWTDATWNPVRGCTKVSPGCKHCYAETFSERFRGVKGHPFEHGFDLRLVPEKLTYVHTTGIWRLFWKRADRKWHDYKPSPHFGSLEKALTAILDDRFGCFFG